MMERNLIGELRIMKELNIKPNISALSRKYKKDRHTIKKYYDSSGVPERKKREFSSMWDEYIDEITELFNNPNITKKAIYMYLVNKYDIKGTYNGFKSFTLAKGLKVQQRAVPHVLYEVEPGKQLQVDWKENLSIHLENGTKIEFNVFSATLGYSREHVFIYSSTKTTDDFIRCIIEVFRRLGGVSEEVLTDNMSAIVDVRGKNKKVYPVILQLFKDLGCELKLCKVRTPQTKGKDENSNKFVKWIYAYDYKLKNEQELIDTLENTISSQCNRQINSSTMMPPAKLFEKEKEYLKPLSNRIVLDSYLNEHSRQNVPSTLLILYKGKKYSVPPEYNGRRVDIYEVGESLYIYHNKKLITKHTISQKSINYLSEHYKNGLSAVIGSKEADIEGMAMDNLERLGKLGG